MSLTSSQAYGGVRFCLAEAREEPDPLWRLDWLMKALEWRALARILRTEERRRVA